jgi:hypothetical protein
MTRRALQGRNVHVPLLLTLTAGLATATCGPALKRDLSKTPVGQVGFDDLCGLQGYFDTLELKQEVPPQTVSSSQVEGGTARGGRSRFAFETEFQLGVVRRILGENWQRLPEGLASAKRLDLEVHWSERAGLRRVVTTEDAALIIGAGGGGNDGGTGVQEVALPYHVCLSELLFGAPIYHQRRDALGLAPLPLPKSMTVQDHRDGGLPASGDAGPRPDGGADRGDARSPR